MLSLSQKSRVISQFWPGNLRSICGYWQQLNRIEPNRNESTLCLGNSHWTIQVSGICSLQVAHSCSSPLTNHQALNLCDIPLISISCQLHRLSRATQVAVGKMKRFLKTTRQFPVSSRHKRDHKSRGWRVFSQRIETARYSHRAAVCARLQAHASELNGTVVAYIDDRACFLKSWLIETGSWQHCAYECSHLSSFWLIGGHPSRGQSSVNVVCNWLFGMIQNWAGVCMCMCMCWWTSWWYWGSRSHSPSSSSQVVGKPTQTQAAPNWLNQI